MLIGRGVALLVVLNLACTPNETADPAPGGSTTADEATGSSTGTPTPTTGAASTSSEGTSDAATAATTSASPICGDGVIEGDEACDDGNRDPDDGCDLCAAAPVVLWSMEYGFPGAAYDIATTVAVAPDGGIYAAGVLDGALLGVRKLDSTGATLWKWTSESAAPSLAVTADGGVLVGGSALIGQDAATWVRRFSSDGDEVWTFSELGDLPGPAWATGVEVIGDAVLVTSSETLGATTRKLGVRRLDLATGAEVWQQEYDNDGLGVNYSTSAQDGDVLVVTGWQEVDDVSNEVYVQRWDADGALLSTWTWSSPEWPYNYGREAAALPDGTTVVVAPGGAQESIFEGSHLVGFADDGTVLWEPKSAAPWEEAILSGVAVDGTRALVVGSTTPVDPTSGLVAVYSADGVEQSVQASPGSTSNCGYEAIAIHPDGVVVVGYCEHDDTFLDWWVRLLESP